MCERILHIGHKEERVCDSDGTALRGQRSENGHPGDLDQAGREGHLTVLLKSLGRLRSTEPFSPSSTLTDRHRLLLFSGSWKIMSNVENILAITRESLSIKHFWIVMCTNVV